MWTRADLLLLYYCRSARVHMMYAAADATVLLSGFPFPFSSTVASASAYIMFLTRTQLTGLYTLDCITV